MKRKCLLIVVFLSCNILSANISPRDSLVINYMIERQPQTFWDKNLGSIITGIISFTAILSAALVSGYVSKYNLEKQLKNQLVVTIEKDRMEAIRKSLATIMETSGKIVASNISRSPEWIIKAKLNNDDYGMTYVECTRTCELLKLNVDRTEPKELSLWNCVEVVLKLIKNNESDYSKIAKAHDDLIESAHILFNSFKS
jgi:hypothetical protein